MRSPAYMPAIASGDEGVRILEVVPSIDGAHCTDHGVCRLAGIGGGEPQGEGYTFGVRDVAATRVTCLIGSLRT